MQIFVFDSYQWYCHTDDDMYINVPKLSHLLQQYDPHKPYHVGKWAQIAWPVSYIQVSANPFMYSIIILLVCVPVPTAQP